MMQGLLLLTFVLPGSSTVLHTSPSSPSISSTDTDGAVYGLLEGDLYIGALFSIHDQPSGSTKNDSGGQEGSTMKCGDIREQYGIQRAEVALQTVRKINQDPQLLPNITLGISIRDSCWYAPVALKQSLKFIPGLDPQNRRTTIGVIGPGSSANTIQTNFQGEHFSDKSRFGYFFRVVPSDYYQARVMVDLILEGGYNYVSAVHTEGNYGASGMKAFLALSESVGICTATQLTVPQHVNINTDPVFNQTVLELASHSTARVVVCFCEGRTVRGLLSAIRANKLEGLFHIIGSDGWADRADVIQGLETAAVGGVSIKIHSDKVTDFDENFFKLQPRNTISNPWLEEFWEWRFKCSHRPANNSDRECRGDESLQTGYKQDTKLGFIVKAILALAHSLHHMQVELCGDTGRGVCQDMKPFDGKLYREYLRKLNFTFMSELVMFDENGDPPGHYDIMNFQLRENSSMDYVTIGGWHAGTLQLHKSVQYHPHSQRHAPVFESVCSKECELGHFKHYQDGGECCWSCVRCREEEFLYNETSCKPCHRGWWPNSNKTDCEKIPIENLELDSPETIFVMILATFGIILTIITTLIFIKYNQTPVVKSSSRELSYTILCGISLCFLSTFTLIQKPNFYSCICARILPGTSISLIYSALTTKTNRIARILAVKKMFTSRPRFMTATAQLIIAACLICVEMVAVIFSIIYVPPTPMFYYPSVTRVKLVCHTDWTGMMIPFGFVLLLITVCTYYAVITRNVPENFNEAKFIGFSCYTTCVIWLSYLPIWFGSDIKVIATCICLSLSAYVTLALHFAPKLYIIIFQPHKNDRSFFTTASKDVRCHIGRGQSTGPRKSPVNGSERMKGLSASAMLSSVKSSDEKLTCNQIKRSETLGSSISSNTESSKSRVAATAQGRDGDCQTEEVRLWCANCDAKVKVYPELDSVTSALRCSKMSVLEENSWTGNTDIKNIVINIQCDRVVR